MKHAAKYKTIWVRTVELSSDLEKMACDDRNAEETQDGFRVAVAKLNAILHKAGSSRDLGALLRAYRNDLTNTRSNARSTEADKAYAYLIGQLDAILGK